MRRKIALSEWQYGGFVVPKKIPDTDWFEEQRDLFAVYFDDTPWHATGDRIVRTLEVALRKYASKLDKLPGNFLPMVMDQYLASRWHETSHSSPELDAGDIKEQMRYLHAFCCFGIKKWPYRAFEVIKDLGGKRFWCRDEEDEEFGLYSDGLVHSFSEGKRLFLSVVVEVEGRWHMTYGPLLDWMGLFPGDLGYLASKVARQLYRKEGFSAVVRFNPVPFWAAWTYGVIPAVYHKDEPVIQCWLHGTLAPGFDEALPSTWRRDDAGSKTRWMYRDDNFFRMRQIFLDRKTGKALVLARRPGDFNKIMALLGRRFEQDEERPLGVSALMGAIIQDILGVDEDIAAWERPFSRFDTAR